MQFDWTVRTLKEWHGYYQKAQTANWMQTWAYAQASLKADHLASKLALLIQNDQPVGMMCVQTVRLGPIQIINLKRGPLWFQSPTAEVLLDFAVTFRKEFPKSLWQRLRWMPEYDFAENDQTVQALLKVGFKLRKENFITSWISLTADEASIRKGLQQKWRNCLHKSEKQNLTVRQEQTLKNMPLFFQFYGVHLKSKRYQGPSIKFLTEEFTELAKNKDILFLWALEDGKPVAGIAIAFHGNTASYRLGWNTSNGRKRNAHYLLIWKALILAKEKGFQNFDLGGLLPDQAPGITHFKEGLGGRKTQALTLS